MVGLNLMCYLNQFLRGCAVERPVDVVGGGRGWSWSIYNLIIILKYVLAYRRSREGLARFDDLNQ